MIETLLARFHRPLVELPNRLPDYAASLVKAGVALRGLHVGGVRLPLVDPSPEDEAELERLIEIGLAVVDG